MPPKAKKKPEEVCKNCTRWKTRSRVVQPQVHCKGQPDLLILGTAPSQSDDQRGQHFTSLTGVKYLRSVLKEVTDNYVIDTAVRCYSSGQPSFKAIEACKENWVKTVKEYKPKVVVALGKPAADAVLGKKVKLGSVIGQSMGVDYGGLVIPTVFNYSPAYMYGLEDQKGGSVEKARTLWFDTWDVVQSVVESGLANKPDVRILKSYKHVNSFLDFLLDDYDGFFAYDYETWGDKEALRPELCKEFKILTISVGYDGKGIAFPLDYPDHFSPKQIKVLEDKWVKCLNKNCVKVAHHCKYEHKCNLKRFGFTTYSADTMLVMNVINELAPGSLGAVGRFFGFSWSGYKIEMAGIQKNPIDTPLDALLEYNALDGLLTYAIYDKKDEKLSEKNFRILEMKQNYAMHLAEVEMTGMYIRQEEIPIIRKELLEEKAQAESILLKEPAIKKVERWCLAPKKENGAYVLDKKGNKTQNVQSFKEGDIFNPRSAVQMRRLCKDVLKLPVEPVIKWKKGEKTESYSFDRRTLEPLEDDYPIVKYLNAVRSVNSMLSGFLGKWQTFTGPDGCCHTNYTQDVALTGRLSSTDPNLQNIPNGSPVKRAFGSRWGKAGLILNADYKQLEPRILAGLSRDKYLCEAINAGFDLHTYVASRIFNIKYEDVTPEQRKVGKTINLGQMYGQTAQGTSKTAHISLCQAENALTAYYDRFSGIKKFRLETQTKARRTGEALNLFGEIRHLPDAMSMDKKAKERAERQASNYPMQSTGNHFCLIGLCAVMDLFKARRLPAVVIGTVHDSIIVDFKKKYRRQVIEAVTEGMLIHNTSEYWGDKPVEMAIDISIGTNYKDLEDIVL